MSTVEDIKALFVGKTVASVDLSYSREFNGTQISSITFTDGSTIHLSGEHDCAYLDGRSQDGKYLGSDGLDLDEPEEEEPVSTPAPAGPPPTRLRDVLPPEYIPWFEKAKPRYVAMLDYAVIVEGTPWPVHNLDAKGMMRTFVLAWPITDPESRDYDWQAAQTTGRKTMVGIKQAPWEDAPSIIFADTHDRMGAWLSDFMTTLTG
jgi:hypothetical protein